MGSFRVRENIQESLILQAMDLWWYKLKKDVLHNFAYRK
jgi:hypothetical protein